MDTFLGIAQFIWGIIAGALGFWLAYLTICVAQYVNAWPF